ncbi:MAG: response regulator [Spirochaetes bacterium]|nr:response regulator [Spirochaetota bacterium]
MLADVMRKAMAKKIYVSITIAAVLALAAGGLSLHGSALALFADHWPAILLSFAVLTIGLAAVTVIQAVQTLTGKARSLKRTKARLIGRGNRYRALIDAIDDGILILDHEGFVLFSNHQAGSFLGCDHFDLIGENIRTMFEKLTGFDFWDDESLCDNGSLIAEQYFDGEIRVDGGPATRWLSSRCRGIHLGDDTPEGHILILRDITAIKQKEQELQAARDMAEAGNRAKSSFLANMNHELRTPLSSILGFGQFLKMQKAGLLNERQREYLDHIISSGEHLLEMVNDVLDLSKIDSGKMIVDRKPFDVNLMLSRSPSTIRVIADRKNVEMVLKIEPAMGFLDADEVRLKQVIFNLLSNAIKFTEPGKRVGIDAFAKGETVIISVWDEGCGIEEGDLNRIFIPFEQAQRHTHQGTGLGLPIAKKLVELHGGTIAVSSQPGMGSRFTVIIPGRIPRPDFEVAALSDREEEPFVANKRVLLVDDNEALSELVQSLLQSYGFTVTALRSGNEVLEQLSTEPGFDLVIMDIGNPAGGDDIIRRIKERIKPGVPVIALTGYAMKGDRERFLDIGFDDYMSKPFRIDALMSKIRSTLLN